MKTRKSTTLLTIAFGIFFLSVASYNLYQYSVFKKTMNTDHIIDYKVVESKTHKGGRGSYYTLTVLFNSKNYTLSIDSKKLKNLDKKVEPTLYYAEEIDQVFSNWSIKQSFRIFAIFAVGFIISILILIFRVIKQRKESLS
jgi:cytochrome bd-type quinol oxidase subunit 2